MFLSALVNVLKCSTKKKNTGIRLHLSLFSTTGFFFYCLLFNFICLFLILMFLVHKWLHIIVYITITFIIVCIIFCMHRLLCSYVVQTTSPPLLGPVFVPRSLHVGFVVDESESGQVFLGDSPIFPCHKFISLISPFSPCLFI